MRLAEDLLAKYCNLVGANDKMLRITCCQCFGFLSGQALDQVYCRLFGQPLLIDVGGAASERQPQPRQQFAAIR
ncbi:hypothetical protein D9M73_292590 [compost metagenome]